MDTIGMENMKNKAVFFDRDGTLVKLVNGHAPWKEEELELYPISCLNQLKDYQFFIISNQPDAAKGHTTYSELHNIQSKFKQILELKGIHFTQYYYCYHRTQDNCRCKKPSPYFLLKAAKDYHIDLPNSWMIGDRESDILAGINAGCKTILVNGHSNIQPNHTVRNIIEAVNIIIGEKK